jgi:hypothetical protein
MRHILTIIRGATFIIGGEGLVIFKWRILVSKSDYMRRGHLGVESNNLIGLV